VGEKKKKPGNRNSVTQKVPPRKNFHPLKRSAGKKLERRKKTQRSKNIIFPAAKRGWKSLAYGQRSEEKRKGAVFHRGGKKKRNEVAGEDRADVERVEEKRIAGRSHL